MEVVAGNEEMARVAGVGSNTFMASVVKVTLVEPKMVAVVETDQRAPTGEFEVAKADIHRPRFRARM